MDTSEYMPMFLAETREHLQTLNLAVLALEADPANQRNIDEIFRVAHSLKGMSATMGFTRIAELTHVMEDVFELLRQRTKGLDEEAITTVLACLDALDGAVNAIEAGGLEQLDPEPLITRLRQLIYERTPEQRLQRAGGADVPTQHAIDTARDAGARVLHILTALDGEVMMPAVRAHMVLAALSGLGELVGSIPTPDAIEHFDGHVIEAWLASEHEQAAVAGAASAISEVVGVEVEELQGNAVTPTLPVAMALPEPAPRAARDAPPQAPGARSSAAHRAARTVRVDADRLDNLLQLMGELVIRRTAVETHAAESSSRELHAAVQDLTRSSQALQAMVMQVRMIPIEAVFLRIPRLVRDLQARLDKQVQLDLVGRETELDRTVVDAIGDPLVHLVRNALDHGLETAAERVTAGKPPVGRLTISARHVGTNVVIEVSDDGRGIDPQQVGRKALEHGLIDADTAAQLDLHGAIELIFTPGFSTADQMTELSGRGVGLDAVRDGVRELGGEVLMDSTPGQGTSTQIRLPLTLAIVSALLVEIGGAPFAVPLGRVERTLRLDKQQVHQVTGQPVLSLPDGVIPLISGASAFGRPAGTPEQLAVIVRAYDSRIALTVGAFIGQRELVTRPVPTVVSTAQPVSGGAVLADGQIALIVDCDAIPTTPSATRRQAPQPTDPATELPELVNV